MCFDHFCDRCIFTRTIIRTILAGVFAVAILLPPAFAQTVQGPPRDAKGWTVFTQSSDTRVIYVSSSAGNDGNGGLSEASPVQTLAKGASLLRQGFPDWLLLKKGDTWSGDVEASQLFGGYQGSEGIPADARRLSRCCISSYGTGARPLIQAWTSNATDGGSILASSPSDPNRAIDYLAIVGIEFYASKSDPNAPTYDGSVGPKLRGISVTNAYNWVLVEDCKTRFLGHSFSWSGNLLMRRSVVTDNFGMGVYTEGNVSVLLEENLFDHNGWFNNVVAPRQIFTHNVYGAHTDGLDETIIYRGNISANGSDVGLRSRQGGLMDNNLSIQDAWAFDYGNANSRPSNVGTNAIQNNVVLFTDDNTTGKTGISVTGILQSSVISNNLFRRTRASALPVSDVIYLRASSHDVVYQGNVILDTQASGGRTITDEGTNNSDGGGNIFYTDADIGSHGFPDPARTIDTYATSVGLAPSVDAFLSAVRLQSKDNWNPLLTAAAANQYIRDGFNMNPSLPSTSQTSSTTSATSSSGTTTAGATSATPTGTTTAGSTSATSSGSTSTTAGTTSTSSDTSNTVATTATTSSGSTSTTAGTTSVTPTPSTTPKIASNPAPLTLTITSPTNGASIKGNGFTSIAVTANGAAAVTAISIMLDGKPYLACTQSNLVLCQHSR